MKIELPDYVLESAVAVLSVANTAPYLLKRLRRAVQWFADEFPLDELLEELRNQIGSFDKDDLSGMAYAYSLFALITFANYGDVKSELLWIQNSNLRWIKDVVSYYKHTAVDVSTATIKISSPINTGPMSIEFNK